MQRDLAQRLGVSQTPVRIGLSELEREGLVEVGETGRALVSRLTREDLEEIYAARLGLEGLAARVGVARDRRRRASSACASCSASSTGSRSGRTSTGYLAAALGFPRRLLRGLRPAAPPRRGRAALLARRALQPPRPLERRAVPALGRLLPRVLRGLRAPRPARGRARDPRQHPRRRRHDRADAAVRAGGRGGSGRSSVGADVGGTFTDVLLRDAGRARCGSRRCCRRRRPTTAPWSTPSASSPAPTAPRSRASSTARPSRRTPCSSAAARATALVTTEGFRDVLELRRMRMPHLYDYFWTKPPSLVAAPAALRDRRARDRRRARC